MARSGRRQLVRALNGLRRASTHLLPPPGLLLVRARAAGAEPRPETVWGWLPPPPARPGSLLVVDTTGVGPETQVALAVLQGLANTRLQAGGPAAYLMVPEGYGAYPEGDRLWPEIYAAQLGVGLREGTAEDIAALARERGVERYVVWDPDRPSTINVATTLAWVRGAAAFAPNDAAGPLAGGMSRLLDLRAESFAGAAAAYRWALDQVAGSAPDSLALLSVGDMPGDETEGEIRWTPRDYAIHTRAFTWAADINQIAFDGTRDLDLHRRILDSVGSGTRSMYGWSNDEAATVILASRRGLFFFPADTPGLPAQNLSVHTAMRTGARQTRRPAPPELDENAVYATIVVTDADNIGVLIDFHEGRWQDPQRGAVPLGWSMQGMAPAWTPGMARHYFDSSTDNDELVAWLPFGYPDLTSFVGAPNWHRWVRDAQTAMRFGGLEVGQNFPHLPSVEGEEASGLWDLLHGPDAPGGHMIGYIGPPALYPVGEPLWVDGRPVLPTGGLGYEDLSPAATAVSAIARAAAANPARPLFLNVTLGNGTSYADAVEIVRAGYDEPVQFVLPGQIVELMRGAWERGLAGTTLLGLDTPVPAECHYLVRGDGGSGPVLFGAEGELRTARTAGGKGDGASWTYRFNVERCRAAALQLTALGRGSVEVSGDGVRWRRAVLLDVPQGSAANAVIDVSGELPTSHLWVRLAGNLTVTGLRLRYNVRWSSAVETATLPAGHSLVLPAGENLIAGESPVAPEGATAVRREDGTCRISVPAPEGGVTAQRGYAGTAWVGWSLRGIEAGATYLFRLGDMTGTGELHLGAAGPRGVIASQTIALDDRPQTVTLLIRVPTGSGSADGEVQLQARTHRFPLEATLTPSVRRVP